MDLKLKGTLLNFITFSFFAIQVLSYTSSDLNCENLKINVLILDESEEYECVCNEKAGNQFYCSEICDESRSQNEYCTNTTLLELNYNNVNDLRFECVEPLKNNQKLIDLLPKVRDMDFGEAKLQYCNVIFHNLEKTW